MSDDPHIYNRINHLEISSGRTDQWKESMFERVKRLEDTIPEIQRTITRSEVRLSIIIGVLIFAANWLFRQ